MTPNYDSIVYNPITYYPVPKPTTEVGQQVLDKLPEAYEHFKVKSTAIEQRKPQCDARAAQFGIFAGRFTGDGCPAKKGLQFYEVIPVALIVAEHANGGRRGPWLPHLYYFEGELIDADQQAGRQGSTPG